MDKVKFEEALALETMAGDFEQAAKQAHLSTEMFEASAAETRRNLGVVIKALFPVRLNPWDPRALVRYEGKTYLVKDGALTETPVEEVAS